MNLISKLKIITDLWIVLVTISTVSGDALEHVQKSCHDKLDFKSIAEFKTFISHYKGLSEGAIDIKQDLFLKRCVDEKESLYALEELVVNYDRKRPCKGEEITKLEAYAEKYLLNKKRPLALKFYTLFGVNIGFICQLNLLAHINQADIEVDQVDFIYSMASPTGWNVLINEHTKKSMKFGSSANAEGNLINRIAKLVPGLVRVDQLKYLNFNHVMNSTPSDNWTGIEQDSYKPNDYKSTEKLVEYLDQIVQSCKNLDQFYFNLLLPLARLKELGLLVAFESLTSQHEHSVMLHKWLAASSFCQLMVRVSVERDVQSDEIKIKLIHQNSLLESRRKLYSYVAEFEEINPEAVEHAWLASVPEGDWCRANGAMFNKADKSTSMAMRQLKQFIKGLEHDYVAGHSRPGGT